MSSGSRFETDLQAVRAARGLSLAQIQQETRIPVDVLRRFEEGDLIGDPTYNEVYLKAFLKSYAKAIGLPPVEVMKAYQAHRAGGYQGALSPSYKGASASPDPPPVETAPSPAPPDPEPEVPAPVKAVREQVSPAKPSPKPSTIPTQRVTRVPVPSARHSYDKNWGLIIGLFIGAVAILGSIIWFVVLDGGGDSEIETVDEPGVMEVDTSAEAAQVATAKRLQLPITVTVTAGGNGLQNFRVTEAPDERRGYWIEPGASETYESDSLIVLWGEGAEGLGPDAILELQGEQWVPTLGSVLRLDALSGQRLLDSLTTAPSTAQPAPTGAE